MVLRPAALALEVDRFLLLAAIAHEDLLSCSQHFDSSRCRSWRDVKMLGLKEAAKSIKQHGGRLVRAFGSAFDDYETAAMNLVAELPEIGGRASALAAAYGRMRQEADRVLTLANRLSLGLAAAQVLSSIVLSVGLSIFAVRYEASYRNFEGRQDRDLGVGSPCTEEDRKQQTPAEGTTGLRCRAWDFTAWRNSHGFEFRAESPDVDLLLATARWVNRAGGAGRVINAPVGPRRNIPFWACGVQKDAEIRFIVWFRGRGARESIKAVAWARDKDESHC